MHQALLFCSLAGRGQSSIANAGTKTPIDHLLSSALSRFLFPFIALTQLSFILTVTDLCDWIDYVQMGRKYLKYCTNSNQKCKKIKNKCFLNMTHADSVNLLKLSPCILQPYASSFISSIPRHHHYNHQRRR